MADYEKYVDKVKELYPNFDRVDETKDAFIFTDTSYKQDGCIVVMKATGKLISMSEYVMMED